MLSCEACGSAMSVHKLSIDAGFLRMGLRACSACRIVLVSGCVNAANRLPIACGDVSTAVALVEEELPLILDTREVPEETDRVVIHHNYT